MARLQLRLAVGDPHGRRSALWRIAEGRDGSIYMFARSWMDRWKVSLHPSGEWHFAFQDEQTRQRFSREPGDRFVDRWRAPGESAPGLTDAARIQIAESQLRPLPLETSKEITWLPAPSVGAVREILLLLASPEVPRLTRTWPTREQGTHLVRCALLASGFTAWVLHREIHEDTQMYRNLRHTLRGTHPLHDPHGRVYVFRHPGRHDRTVLLIELAWHAGATP